MTSYKRSPMEQAYKAVRILVLLATAFAILAPLVVMASTAFKVDGEIYDFPMSIIP
mgnify:CR=1 FL=1